MLSRRLASAPLITGLLIATFVVARAGEPRALLELFTSQGCSSCPAADKLLGDYAADPSLIALSVPIDYWDYLGWKDTLASPAHSARQRAYARVRGDRQVYTPQIVVNGSMHVLGSDRAAIERVIAQTDQKPAVMSLPVLMSVGGTELNVKVESAENEHSAGEVWLKLGDWTGTQSTWNVPISDLKTDDVDAAVVMVQEGSRDKPGIILGAAYAPLN